MHSCSHSHYRCKAVATNLFRGAFFPSLSFTPFSTSSFSFLPVFAPSLCRRMAPYNSSCGFLVTVTVRCSNFLIFQLQLVHVLQLTDINFSYSYSYGQYCRFFSFSLPFQLHRSVLETASVCFDISTCQNGSSCCFAVNFQHK